MVMARRVHRLAVSTYRLGREYRAGVASDSRHTINIRYYTKPESRVSGEIHTHSYLQPYVVAAWRETHVFHHVAVASSSLRSCHALPLVGRMRIETGRDARRSHNFI